MFRTFLWYFTIFIIFILTIPIWCIAKLFPGKDERLWPQRVLNAFGPFVKRVAGFNVEVSGKENLISGPALYVGNHQGMFDIIIALMDLGDLKPFVAKKEIGKIPFIGSWMKMFGCVLIDRGNARASLESLKEVEDLLKNGRSVIIFPEGTRSRSSTLGEFKQGSFRPAIKAKVPVIPFAIDGSYLAFEANGSRLKPVTAKLTILEPIDTASMDRDTAKNIAQSVQEKIKEALA